MITDRLQIGGGDEAVQSREDGLGNTVENFARGGLHAQLLRLAVLLKRLFHHIGVKRRETRVLRRSALSLVLSVQIEFGNKCGDDVLEVSLDLNVQPAQARVLEHVIAYRLE